MKYVPFLLMLIFFSCKTKQAVVVYTNLRDSTKIELIATPIVVNKLIKDNGRTERTLISAIKRSSIVEARNETKQNNSDNKRDAEIARLDNAVKKTEARKAASVENKKTKAIIVAKKQLPNSLKWGAVLLIAIIFGWLVIKKKIPFLR